jgi:dolichol kinase
MLHASLTQLSTNPTSPLPGDWNIENPLLLQSTPLRYLQHVNLAPTDAAKALSALATSRRNLVQLFTLLAFVMLVHLARSMHLVHKLAKTPGVSPASAGMERENSDSSRQNAAPAHSTYWLRRGELRRTRSVVGFAFLVTTCCGVVKICTAYVGRSIWSGECHLGSSQ